MKEKRPHDLVWGGRGLGRDPGPGWDDVKALFAALIVLVVSITLIHTVSCVRKDQVVPTLTITADACEQLAGVYDRPDIAEGCRHGGDVAPLLEILLGESKARQQAKDAGAE